MTGGAIRREWKDAGRAAALLYAVCAAAAVGAEVWVTVNTTLPETDTRWEGSNIVVSAATLTVDGAHTFANLTLTNGAVLTHSAATLTTAPTLSLTVPGRLAIASDSRIDVTGKGYRPGRSDGNTTTLASTGNAGGSHGGPGGDLTGVPGGVYGSAYQPVKPGGGAADLTRGGAGGGAVRVVAGEARIDGRVAADGAGGFKTGGGGAGGSIWLTVGCLGGIGSLRAHGGATGVSLTDGGGGGGRVAVYCDAATDFDLAGCVTARGGSATRGGGAGTVYTRRQGHGGVLRVDNTGLTGARPTPVTLRRDPVYPESLILAAAAAEAVPQQADWLVSNLTVAAGCSLTYALTDAAASSGLRVAAVGDVVIAAGALVDATAKGYGPGQTPDVSTVCASTGSAGGSHGGVGGSYGGTAGAVYGQAGWPTACGAGGGSSHLSGSGGGRVQLAARSLRLDGEIVVDGGDGTVTGGGGAGGSVLVDAGTLSGSGAVAARGGAGALYSYSGTYIAGGGGGGRIALYAGASASFTPALLSVAPGKGQGAPQAGSAFTADQPASLHVEGVDLSVDESGVVTGLVVRFNTAIYPTSLDAGRVSVAGPVGPVGLSAFTVLEFEALVVPASAICVEGAYTLTLPSGVTTLAGCSLPEDSVIPFTFDRTPPAPPGVAGLDPLPASFVASSRTLMLSGVRDDDSAVWIGDSEAVSVGSGPWSVSWALVEGTNDLAVRAVDAVGNASSDTVYRIVADTIPPAVAGLTPAADAWLAAAPDGVDVQVSEAGSGLDAGQCIVRVTRGGLAVPGTWAVQADHLVWAAQGELLDGAYAVRIELADRAGNAMLPHVSAFTVDRIAPPPPSVTPVESPTTVSRQTVSGWKESGTAVRVNGVERVPAGDGTGWNLDLDLTGGRNTFLFTCCDRAGNLSDATPVEIVFDDQAPGPVTDLVLRAEGDGETVEADWSGYDEEVNGADLARYVVYVSSSPFSDRAFATPVLTNAAGNRLALLHALPRGVPSHVAVVAYDLGGRSSADVPSTPVVPVDTLPPGPVRDLSATCGETSVALSWSPPSPPASDLGGYAIELEGAEVARLPAAASGYTVEGLASASVAPLAVRALDASGNASAPADVTACTWLPAVGGVTAEPGHECATVGWVGVEPAACVAHYAVYRADAPFDTVEGRQPAGTAAAAARTFPLTGLPNGQTTYVAVAAVNVAGAVRPGVSCVPVTAVADTTGPSLSAIRWDGQPLPVTAVGAGTLSVEAVDPAGVTSVAFSIDGEALPEATARGATYEARWRPSTAADGVHAICVRATDALGNAAETIGELDLRLAAPGAPVVLEPAAGSLHPDSTVRILGRVDDNATGARLLVNGAASGAILSLNAAREFAADAWLAEGTNRLSAVALNRAGESGAAPEREVVVDTRVPLPPTGVAAASRELGAVRVTWSAPAGVLPAGYHVYRAMCAFTDRAAAERVTAVPCGAVSLSDLPPADGRYVYRVAAVSRSGIEGALSEEAWAESDATLPEALAIAYTPAGPHAGNRFAAGAVEVRVTVSEPLLALPFLSFTRPGETPWLVPLSPAGENVYAGMLTVSADTANGDWYATFSARDRAANSGTAIRAGGGFVVDTTGPVPSSVTLSPVLPLRNDPAAPTSVVVVTAFLPSSPPAAAPSVRVRLQAPAGSDWRQVVVEPLTSASWAGVYAFDAESGVPAAPLAVEVAAVDDLGNASTTCVTRSGWLVYQGEVPTLPPPEHLAATAGPGGRVALGWAAVEGASDFEVRRRSPDSDTPLVCGRSGGVCAFTDAPVEGTNLYAVCSVRAAPPDESVGPPSVETAVVADATPPDAPTALQLELGGSGVRLSWEAPLAADTAVYSVYRAPDRITATSVGNCEPILRGVRGRTALDPDPPQRGVYYAVSALDAAGNESAPSESAYTNLTLVPVTGLSAVRTGAAPPVVSWRHAAADGIGGFRVYGVDGDERRLLSTDMPAADQAAFADPACGRAGRLYEVVAVDSDGEPRRESPGRRVSVPWVEVTPAAGAGLWRGLMNGLDLSVVNRGPGALSNAVLSVSAGGATALSAPFCAAVGTTQAVGVVLSGAADLPDTVCVTTHVAQVSEGGERTGVTATHALPVGNGMLTAELRHGGLIRGGEVRAAFTVRNPGSAGVEMVAARGGGARPSDEVRWSLETPDGFVLAVVPVRQGTGESLVTLADGTTVLRVPAGGQAAFGETAIPVPATTGDRVVLRLTVERLHHGLGGVSPMSVAGFSSACEGAVSATPYEATATGADPAVSRGSAITIRGRAAWREAGGGAAAGVPVAVCVRNAGVVWALSATTDAAGEWMCGFEPEAGRSGVFEVWAGHPEERASLGQCAFVVNRAAVSPAAFEVTVPRNYGQALAVTLAAAPTLALTNARLVAAAADGTPAGGTPAGVHVEPAPGVSIAPGGRAGLDAAFWGDNSAAATGTFALAVVSDGEAQPWASVPVRYRLTEAAPAWSWQPGSLLLGVTPGSRNTAALRVGNTGYAELQGGSVGLRMAGGGAAPAWLRVSPAALGDLASGTWREVSLCAEPPAGTATDRHNVELVLSASNLAARTVAAAIAVTASGAGDALFRVSDLYFGQVTGGVTNRGVCGATVRVRRAASVDAEQTARTDASGECLFRDLPAGVYDFRATADGHDGVSGTVRVDPGVAVTRDVFLPCRVVSVDWRVVPTTIEDRYEIVLEATYETDVPAAVVLCSPMSVTLPQMEPGDVFQGEFRLRNVGLIRADDVRAIVPATDAFFRIELTGECPSTLAAGQERVMPFRVTCLAPLSGEAGATGSVYGNTIAFEYQTVCAKGQVQKSKATLYLLGSTDSRVNPVTASGGPRVITLPGGIGDTTVVMPGHPVVTSVDGDRCTDDLHLSLSIAEPEFAVGCGVPVRISVDGCVGEGCPSSVLVQLLCDDSAYVLPEQVTVTVGDSAEAVLYGISGSAQRLTDKLKAVARNLGAEALYTVVEITRVEARDSVAIGQSTQARAVTLPPGWPVEWLKADVHGGASQVLATIDASSGTVRVDAESGLGWVVARAEPVGVACAKRSGKQKKIEIECPECSSCDQVGGNGGARVGSMDVSIGLGVDSEGESAGRLYVYEESLNTNAWRPSGLRVALDSDEAGAVYDLTGRVRQVWAPAGVADVVCTNDDGYAVRWYGWDQVSGVASNGVRAVSGEPVTEWAFRRADAGASETTRVDVVKTEGGLAVTNRYEASEDDSGGSVWTLTQGNGLKRTRLESAAIESDARVVVTEVCAGSGTGVASRVVEWKTEYAWGEEVVRREMDTGGEIEVSTWMYDANQAATGMYGRVIAATTPGGGWATYGYDTSGRLARVVECWKDESQWDGAEYSKVTRYTYDPVDPRDDGSLWPDAARVRQVEVCGVPTERSYAAYFYGERLGRVEVFERCASPDGEYGAAGNQRTTTTYHSEDGSAADARVERVEHADGRLDTYTYTHGTWTPGTEKEPGRFEENGDGTAWRRIQVHGTVARPEGVALRTTREVTVRDGSGHTVMAATEVYTGAGYARIAWTEQVYDGRGRLVRTARSNGEVAEQAWGCCGLEREVDAGGGVAVYRLDALSRRTGVTRVGVDDAEFGAQPDRRVAFELDAAGRRVSVTRAAEGEGVTYRATTAYDLAGQATNRVTEGGVRTRVTRHSGGRIERTVTPDGLVRVSEAYRSGAAKCVTENDVLAAWSDAGVNADGTTWAMVWAGPLGTNSPAWQRTVEDALGRTVRTDVPAFGGGVLTNRFFFDATGRLVRATSPGVADRLYAYDELGEKAAIALDVNGNGRIDYGGPDRVQAYRSWYEFGERRGGAGGGEGWWIVRVGLVYPTEGSEVAVTNRVHRQRLTGFDAGCVAEGESIDAWGNVTVERREVDRERRLVRTVVDTPESATNAVRVELNGLLVRDVSVTGVETRYSHDGFGRVVSSSNAAVGRVQAGYGPDDRVQWTRDGGGGRTTFGFDPDTGRVTSMTNANTNATFCAYDAWGRPTAEWGAVYPVLRVYDAFGRVSGMGTVRDAEAGIARAADFTSGAVRVDFTGWLYDDATGLLTNKVYADGTRERYGYTPAWRLAWRERARGVVTRYGADPASGEVTNVVHDGVDTPAVAMRYDRLGRPVWVRDGLGEHVFVFGERGELNEESLGGADGYRIGYTYAATGRVGRLSGVTTDSGWRLGYGYDGVGRLDSVTARAMTDAGERARTARYAYEPGSGFLTGWDNGEGWSVTRGVEPETRRLASVVNTWQGVDVARHGYRTDAGGRRTQRVDSGPFWPPAGVTNAFAYNARDELLAAGDGGHERRFAFDSVGNRVRAAIDGVETVYDVNAVNACTQIVAGAGVTLPGWDPDGNLLWDGRWRYNWDAENRLAGCDPVDETNGARRVRFAYDYAGRRVRADVDERVAGGWEARRSTRYVWSGWQMLGEWTSGDDVGGGTGWQFHAWGADVSGVPGGAGGVGGLLFTLASDGAVFDYGYDGNGNITATVESGGGTVETRAYTPFGVAASPVPASRPRFGFSTKYTDPETGLLYFGYRYYSPESARWLSRDPLGESAGPNLYTYCRNNPVNGVDALGLAGYFFGGTGNSLDKGHISNVEILYRAWNGSAHGTPHYVPGVFSGKTPEGKDYFAWNLRLGKKALEGAWGKSLGARAEYMLGKLEEELRSGDKEVNVFGFSRGSTTALHFLNRVQAKMDADDPLYKDIKINFVALWDTVKHTATDYCAELPEKMKFEHQPLHFIALDEQRAQFFDEEVLDLGGNALQIGYRGVHADVGGFVYPNKANAFGWISRSDAVAAAWHIGINFDAATLAEYSSHVDWQAVPTDNDTVVYNGGEARTFPASMYVSPTVFQFGRYTKPYNTVSTGHRTIMTRDWYRWAGKDY